MDGSEQKTVLFEECPNAGAPLEALKPTLVWEYLSTIGSPLAKELFSRPDVEVFRELDLVSDTPEGIRSKNAALLFFNDRPEHFIPGAYIIVRMNHGGSTANTVERTFTGPLNRQIIDVDAFIRNNLIALKVIKRDDRAEADRILNYPIGAIEDAISYAVCNKDYRVPDPIFIVITKEKMEISCTTHESIPDCRMEVFLRGYGLMESDDGQSRFDSMHPQFREVFHKHPVFIRKTVPETNMRTSRRTRQEIIDEVIATLSSNGEMSMRDLSDAMGYRNPPTSLKAVVSMLMSDGTLEYTQKERASPYQRIRLVRR